MVQQKIVTEPIYYDDEIDLVELFKTLFKYWKLIISITLIATVIAVLYAMLATPIFKAETKFFIPKQDKSSLSGYMSAINSLGFGGLVGGDSSTEVVLNFINSRRMAKDVVIKFNLVQFYNQNNSVDDNPDKLMFSAINNLKGSMSVNNDKTGLITLGIESTDPQLAADIANFIVINLDIMNEELRISSQKPMVTVLDPAEKPLLKAKPKKKMIVIIGFMTGAIFSVFLAFLIDYARKAFK